MPSYELDAFAPCPAVRIVAATELVLPATLNILFLAIDPEQRIDWSDSVKQSNPSAASMQTYPRRDKLWEQTCFEVFVGIKDQPDYREINLSPQQYWNCYRFEDYRQPDVMPPAWADDIELIQLSCQANKLQATLNLQQFIQQQDCYLEDIKLGICAVIQLNNQKQLFYALQHSGHQADFHRRQDWIVNL
ncbi:DOMON-like domain-containing protein [Alkanindiges sp. WGS2144]|uniref:DOMON-like domain-containing protein n=1 Tax=Alkanindiges sp. WGS2144 TaxID=3366808 RepID=UPI00375131EB